MEKPSNRLGLSCPICGEPVAYRKGEPLPPGFPFCSPRCKLVDLDNWFSERYVVERQLTHEEQTQIDPEKMSKEDLMTLIQELQARVADKEEEDEFEV